jgi:hypothetical protein
LTSQGILEEIRSAAACCVTLLIGLVTSSSIDVTFDQLSIGVSVTTPLKRVARLDESGDFGGNSFGSRCRAIFLQKKIDLFNLETCLTASLPYAMTHRFLVSLKTPGLCRLFLL